LPKFIDIDILDIAPQDIVSGAAAPVADYIVVGNARRISSGAGFTDLIVSGKGD